MGALRQGLGFRLAQLRRAGGWKQTHVARKARIDPKHLGAIERGERNLTIDYLEQIIHALGAEAYEPFLFNLQDPRGSEKTTEDMLLSLVRHSDKTVRPALISVAQAVLRLTAGRRKK